MKKTTLLVTTLLLCFRAMFAQPPASSKILPNPIIQKKLANGLNVVTVPFDSPGLAAFYIVVRAGSRDEVELGKNRLRAFLRTHDVSRNRQISEGKIQRGSEINRRVRQCQYQSRPYALSYDRQRGKTGNDVRVESDRFMNLKYSLQDFKTEAGAVKGEYTKNSASPYTLLNEQIQNTAFDSHTYKHTTMGFFKDIVDMPNQYDYSKTFFNRFYRPEYCTIIVVGDVTPERVQSLADKYFGKWEHGNYVTTVEPEPEQKSPRSTHIKKAGFPAYIDLNYKGPAFNDRTIDMPALDVLSSILFSEKSELYKKLVLNEQKARFINGGAQDSRDPYLISIGASLVKAEDMQYVKDQILAALEKAKTTPVDPQILKETQMHLKYQYAMRIDNATTIAESLSAYTWLTGDPEALNRQYAQYEKVTPADLMMVASKYFIPAHLTIGTISAAENDNIQ